MIKNLSYKQKQGFLTRDSDKTNHTMTYRTSEDSLFTLYDVINKVKIGIFRLGPAARFIYGIKSTKKCASLASYAREESKVLPRSSKLPFPCAVRFASDSDRRIVGDSDYVMLDNNYADFLPKIFFK